MARYAVKIAKIQNSNGEQTLEDALVNVIDGLGPKTTEGVLLTKMGNGTYMINDGFHRIAKAILEGREFIRVSNRRPLYRK